MSAEMTDIDKDFESWSQLTDVERWKLAIKYKDQVKIESNLAYSYVAMGKKLYPFENTPGSSQGLDSLFEAIGFEVLE